MAAATEGNPPGAARLPRSSRATRTGPASNRSCIKPTTCGAGAEHEAQPDAQQHATQATTGQTPGGPSIQRPPQHQQRQQEQETAETAPAVHEDPETGADPRREQHEHSHTASGEAPPNHRQPSGPGTHPQTTQPEPQAEQGAPTSHGGHSSAPSGDTQNNQQQRQERQHPPPAGYHHTAAASSSSETGTPSSAAQQWGRYTPGAGDQRTRNKADKTWIHAEFAKRGWKKPPHLTWRQVEHWLQGPEQRERGEQEQQRQAPPKPHQPGRFTQLLNLHLLPRNPPQGTSPPTEPSDPTAASSTQAPHQPQQGTQEQTADPQQEDPTSKRATWAQQQAEERAQHPVPQAAAAGTRPQPSQPAWEGDDPIQVRAPPNEDPTSKEGTRAQERAQQRQQTTRPANRTQQGSEQARQGQGTRDRGVSCRTNTPRVPPVWQRLPPPERIVATRKQYTCHLTLLKLPGSTAACRPPFHHHYHSRPTPKCYVSIAGAADGISASYPSPLMRSHFWPRVFTLKCFMHRGQRGMSNGSPWERGSSQHP